MPSQSYGRFQRNLETVTRLQESYEIIRRHRSSRGKGAFDHITRSAVLFLVSAFEVYIEEVTCECCELNISLARDAQRLPHGVRSTIDCAVTKKNTSFSPISLCDEGWRDVYRQITQEATEKFNTPKVPQVKQLFGNYIGTTDLLIDGITNIDRLDDFVRFRGEITHRVKATSYVKIEKVVESKALIEGLVREIDKMLLNFLHAAYPDKRAPWNNTY